MRQTVNHVSMVSGLVAWCLLAAVTLRANPLNSLFNPSDYPSVDTSLVLTGGTVVVDTKDGSNAPTWTYNGALAYTGRIVTNQSGKVVLALFDFGGLVISSGVSCTVTGNLGLVIASTGDLTFASTLDLSGTGGSSALAGQGGPGAEAGVRTNVLSSAPPGATRGNGGRNGTQGVGFGAGNVDTKTKYCGGGGGYGGAGGYGYKTTDNVRGDGGLNYGDSVMSDLLGGSGGGGGMTSATGGGGGGALELIASGLLTVSDVATVKVNGASAVYGGTSGYTSEGGGSGGGIILGANRLAIYGTLQAKGGNGKGTGTTGGTSSGGGGGGGRISLYANVLATNASTSVSVSNGLRSHSTGQDGTPGTFRWFGDGVDSADLSFPFARELPSIAVAGATDLHPRSVSLVANLLSAGGDPNAEVYCWWGTNASPWDSSAMIGPFASAGYVTNSPAGLTPDTTYYYTFAVSNSVGMVFAPSTNSFRTTTLWPTIANAGASNVTASAGTVYGYLSNTGESATVVYLFYGTVPGMWTGVNRIDPGVPGPVSNSLSGFAPNTACYYQFAASNAAGWGFAPTTNWFVTLPVPGRPAQQNSLFNPQRYAMLADSLNVANGTIVIDTGDGATRGPSMTVNGTVYRGQVVPTQSSNVWLSLFNFGSVSIDGSVSCAVTGNLGLVLASTHDLTIGTTLDLSGMGSSSTTAGQGGPGAEGGVRTNSLSSAPPGALRGNGGFSSAGGNSGQNGTGFGGGTCSDASNMNPGSGGGYGGIGGYGYKAGLGTRSPGGTNYGDNILSDLFGGSGGGAGALYNNNSVSAGGGGGTLELVAQGVLTISATATQRVNGGTAGAYNGYSSGGGGSGGGMILAANRLIVSGALEAKGGNGLGGGGASGSSGGGGGGGRIAIYANALATNATAKVSVAGGSQGGGAAQNGAPGTFRYAGDGGPGDLSFPYPLRGTVLMLK